jgi:hypothetical protein
MTALSDVVECRRSACPEVPSVLLPSLEKGKPHRCQLDTPSLLATVKSNDNVTGMRFIDFHRELTTLATFTLITGLTRPDSKTGG